MKIKFIGIIIITAAIFGCSSVNVKKETVFESKIGVIPSFKSDKYTHKTGD